MKSWLDHPPEVLTALRTLNLYESVGSFLSP